MSCEWQTKIDGAISAKAEIGKDKEAQAILNSVAMPTVV
jgi:hypothetical protein